MHDLTSDAVTQNIAAHNSSEEEVICTIQHYYNELQFVISRSKTSSAKEVSCREDDHVEQATAPTIWEACVNTRTNASTVMK